MKNRLLIYMYFYKLIK